MSKYNARFNDAPLFPVKRTDNMTLVFAMDTGILIDETGDGSFFPFNPEEGWPDCDDSAYYAALAEVLTYIIEVAASVDIYNVPGLRASPGCTTEDVIRRYERAIKGALA